MRLRTRGLCFRFSPSFAVRAFQAFEGAIHLRENASVTFALHETGEDFWLSEGITPTPISVGSFTQGEGGNRFADVLVK